MDNKAEIISIPKTQVNGKKMSLIEKMSYGSGDFASNMIWGLVGSFLLYFYTDVTLVPVAAAGTLLLVTRILDAIIDPVIGGFIDRTNSKWGRTKPYIIFGILPLCFFYVLTFTSFDFSDSGKIIYAYITFIITGLLYSVVNIPYGALMPLMTRDSSEKNQLSSFRMGGMAIGNTLVAACTMPLVGAFGQGDEQRGFFFTAIIYSILGIIAFTLIIKNCKERYVEVIAPSKEKQSLRNTYKSAFKNTPWVSTMLFSLLLFIKIGAVVSITIYYCIQVLGNPAMVSILLPLLYVSMLVSAAITTPVLNKFGHRKGNILTLGIFIAGMCILPFFSSQTAIFVTVYFIVNVFNGIGAGSVFGMTADSVDYNEWKFGMRSEGTLYAGYSFATKVGMAIGGAVVGYLLALVGYNAENVSGFAKSSINFSYFFIPILISILQIIAISFYKLDSIHKDIVAELEEKRIQS
ncbi:MFS transporter [Bacillus sp. B1-b2]|uniref:MFS transporter n=1 Tax=Bacillus sp. B1-b2 TaxID=2653201 RepID=UPI00126160C5|nr:MFS transporter [Bacillus sp. B1-b2]KAB7668371.1 MFS transporter [Bacillus sp. B1-b2]